MCLKYFTNYMCYPSSLILNRIKLLFLNKHNDHDAKNALCIISLGLLCCIMIICKQ